MSLDKFYTPIETAQNCISLIPNISQYDLIVEPSAGCGNFSNQLNCIAYDLEPASENIIQQDWLTLNKLPVLFSHCLVVGNPPFGARVVLQQKHLLGRLKGLGRKLLLLFYQIHLVNCLISLFLCFLMPGL